MRVALLILAVLLLPTGSLAAQKRPSFVLVRVTDVALGQPIPNAELLVNATPPARLTDGQGRVRIAWPRTKKVKLLVRQIGFVAQIIEVAKRPEGDSLLVELERLQYQLPEVVTRAEEGCTESTTDDERKRAAIIREQLEIGASRVSAFSREYRWNVVQERRTSELVTPERGPREVVRREVIASADWDEPYLPSRVLVQRRTEWSAAVLFISTLGTPQFWKRHCVVPIESDSTEAKPTVRLAFAPRTWLLAPSWSGTVILDSATAELREIRFRMSGLRRGRQPARLEGVTRFARISPFVMVPSETEAVWWTELPADTTYWPPPDKQQRLITRELRWLGARPPGVDSITIVTSPASESATRTTFLTAP